MESWIESEVGSPAILIGRLGLFGAGMLSEDASFGEGLSALDVWYTLPLLCSLYQ